jgi:hypothetical protein
MSATNFDERNVTVRGKQAKPGDTRTSPNGYHYTRTANKWELTHRLVAELTLGRPLRDNERCTFKDGDRTNLAPDNIVVSEKKTKSNASRRAQLEAKIEALQAELDALDD